MFSVVIPLYNKTATIAHAIQSVLGQTYPHFELIIVDDGSTDNGPDVVRKMQTQDKRIVFLQQANGGVSAARNAGIQAATYEYICFLDADDEYLAEYLENMARLIKNYPECAVWAVRYYFEANGKMKPLKINGIQEGVEGIVEDYFAVASKSAPPIWTGAVCCSRTRLLEIGGFPVGVTSGEDLITWAKMCLDDNPVFSSYYGAIYHLGKCVEFLPTRVPQKDDHVGRELKKAYHTHHIPALRNYIAFWHKNRASCYLRLNMRIASIKESIAGLVWNPFNWKLAVYLILAFSPFYCIKKILGER